MRPVAVASAWVFVSNAPLSVVTQVGLWRPSSPRRDGIHSIELGSSRTNMGNLV